MIGIVSHEGDDHACAVLTALARIGRSAQLIDTAAFPSSLALTLHLEDGARSWRGRLGPSTIDFDSLRAIWWRRPQPYVLDPAIDPGSAIFAYSECHEAMAGMWHGLTTNWVNPPAADEIAHHKPMQLALASRLGLTIPDTLITNDAASAQEFISTHGHENIIYKTFLALEQNWRETRILKEDELGLIAQVRLAPVIFQRFVPAVCDLRVTVFGDEIHATEIVSAPDAYVFDYRVDLSAVSMSEAQLPASVACGILSLLRALGLQYGAVDLRLTPDGEYVFLEVNPAGEFLFVEERTNQDLSGAMARLLCRLSDQPLDTSSQEDMLAI